MTRTALPVFLLVSTAAIGCSGHAAAPVQPAPAQVTDNAVVLAADSPMLKQLRRQRVELRELPTDEIVTPGKLEANPNRVSKVVLPVTGRVTAVLVKTGDAVTKDQPILTIQSPDADAAMSAYLSARAGEGTALPRSARTTRIRKRCMTAVPR